MSFKIALGGDVMLGRLIDQIFPDHVPSEEDSSQVLKLLKVYPKERIQKMRTLQHRYVWGDMLPYIQNADLRIVNFETCATTQHKRWPNKMFNYRMHPNNLQCLIEANIDVVSLANNHILDYGQKGMLETMKSLNDRNIKWAGIGVNSIAASQPAIIERNGIRFAYFSFADHPEMWQATLTRPGINFLNVEEYTPEDVNRIKDDIERVRNEQRINVVIVSLHWGPNYSWRMPSMKYQQFAHDLIEQCGVDIIHGHSSHHIQGIEIYKGKPIFYGCGDLVDDYAVENNFRNDLGFVYNLEMNATTFKLKNVLMIPTKIQFFSVNECRNPKDREWIETKMISLCNDYGTCIQRLDTGLYIDLDYSIPQV